MQLGNIMTVTVGATGEATRRMVDLSLILDVSGSIGGRWPAVRDAARTFIDSFDARNDRLSLLTFSNGAQVLDAMPAARGFDKPTVINHVPGVLPGGSTNMVEGLYRGWDELRSVPAGQQSGLRVIVLFTDGASNGVPADYDVRRRYRAHASHVGLPEESPGPRWPDLGRTTHRRPLRHADRRPDPAYSLVPPAWNSPVTVCADPAAAGDDLAYASPQCGHSHAVPAADGGAEGERGVAERKTRAEKPGPGYRPVSGGRVEYQQRGAQRPRDRRERSAK
jgi:hypothetical protein